MGTIIWNEIPSYSIPIVVENPPNYVSAERDYEATHVLGRNGDLLTDHGSFKNVVQSYDIAFGSLEKIHSEMASAVSEWLHSANGYARLEDSYDPDHFRMAYYMDETELENTLNHLGRATIEFNCMPQRYLKSGTTKVYIGKNNPILLNPTRFSALPLIRLNNGHFGDATLTVNDLTIKIPSFSAGSHIILDCELREAYHIGSGNVIEPMNNKIEWSDAMKHEFPVLIPGENRFSFTGDVLVEVTPRWWVL